MVILCIIHQQVKVCNVGDDYFLSYKKVTLLLDGVIIARTFHNLKNNNNIKTTFGFLPS